MNRLSGRNKLLLPLVALLLFSFVGVSFLNYKITRASIHEEILRNDLPLTMSNIYSELSADLPESIKIQEKYDRAVYLTDTQGVIQVHPDTTLIEKKTIAELEGMADIAEKILDKSYDSDNFEFNRNGNQILLTVRYIPSLDLFLYVQQNETKALAIARKNFIKTLLIGLLASVFIITLTLVTINRYQKRLEILAISDELTGIANRRALGSEFQRILYAHSRSGRGFSLILLDLDGFKKVNDTHGHLIGDRLLVDIVGLIGSIIRPTDILARWGGDEFVILSDNTGEDAMLVAGRIRQRVKSAELGGEKGQFDDQRNLVTVSIGVSVYVEGDDLDAMLYRADQAMYRCKARNGDSVEIAR